MGGAVGKVVDPGDGHASAPLVEVGLERVTDAVAVVCEHAARNVREAGLSLSISLFSLSIHIYIYIYICIS